MAEPCRILHPITVMADRKDGGTKYKCCYRKQSLCRLNSALFMLRSIKKTTKMNSLKKKQQTIWHKTNLTLLLACSHHHIEYSKVILLLFLSLFGSFRLPIWKKKIVYSELNSEYCIQVSKADRHQILPWHHFSC